MKFKNIVYGLIGILWAAAVIAAPTVENNTNPPNVFNLCGIGACGITDGTALFNAAAALAATTGQTLYIPGGYKLNHSGTLTVTSLTLMGDGPTSVLNATDTTTTPHSALLLAGTNPIVKGLNLQTTWTTGGRSTQIYSSAIATTGTVTNPKVLNNYITSAFAGTGIEISYSVSGAEVAGNTITGSVLANPIIFQAGTSLPISNYDVHDNYVTGGGDTCIESIDQSHLATSIATRIHIHDNILVNCGAHGASLLGTSFSDVTNNIIVNPAVNGVYVASENSNTESQAFMNSVVNNTIVTVPGGTPINIFGSATSGTYYVLSTLVANNKIYMNSGGFNGIIVGCSSGAAAPTVFDTHLVNNIIVGGSGAGSVGIATNGCIQDLYIDENTIAHMQLQGFSGGGTGSLGTLRLKGNHFADLSLSGANAAEAIQLQNGGYTIVNVLHNDYTAGANSVSHWQSCSATSYSVLSDDNSGAAPSTFSSGCVFDPASNLPEPWIINQLPGCLTAEAGLRAFVTNGQTSPTFLGTVSSTGAVGAPVVCNGSNWVYY